MTDSEMEAAVTKLVTESWNNLDEVLKRLSVAEIELNPAVEALLFGLLGGFCRGFMEANEQPDIDFDACMSHAFGTALSDPRVEGLIQMTIVDAVDDKVGDMLDG